MTEHYHKWYSQYLSRDFEMLVFGHSGTPLIIFPREKGRYFDYKDSGLISSAASLLDNGSVKIYCPDSIDSQSWYNYSISPEDRVKTHNAYENMILHDVIGFAQFESNLTRVALAGCGFGGYHAVNLALRHPDKISHILSINGFYNIKQFILGHYDDNCYFNNPSDYLPGLTDDYYLDNIKMIDILFCVGTENENKAENLELAAIMQSKGLNPYLQLTGNSDCNSIFSSKATELFSK